MQSMCCTGRNSSSLIVVHETFQAKKRFACPYETTALRLTEHM